MLSLGEIKTGLIIEYEGVLYQVQEAQHVKMGRGGAVLRTKLKNLVTGAVLSRNFKAGDKLEEVDLKKSKATFLYKENDDLYFMDSESFNQFSLPRAILEEKSFFLKDGEEVTALIFKEKPITLEIPKKVALKVTEAPPGLRGDTAQGSVTKTVTLETGLKINVPLFIKEGNVIRVNTDTGEYVERV